MATTPTNGLDNKQSARGFIRDTWEHASPFTYSVLLGEFNIRLLDILPGTPEDPLKCNCIHSSHDDEPQYIAISYTWGDPHPTKPVLIIGQRYYTTQHAHDVLLAMRSPHEVLTVWIDTICIDQANIPEKNDQVWMMGLIYSRAQQTLVWLGPAPHDSDLAMSFIALVIHAFINLADADSVTVTMLLQQTGTEQDSPPWLALGALLARPLFQRVWVVQEVALSPNVTAQCGARKLPWNDIGDVIEHLHTHRLSHLITTESSPSSSNELTSGAPTVWCMQGIRNRCLTWLSNQMYPSAGLFATMGLLATEPKD
jgi:hypothetical protein